MLKVSSRLRLVFMAALLAGAVTSQAQSSASIDFTTIGASPTGGTLANGVTWSVSGPGFWESIVDGVHRYHHYTFNQNQTQTWTFGEAVDVRFSLAGLNCPSEGVRFGGGQTVVVESLYPVHIWDETAQTVRHGTSNTPANGPKSSSFTVSGATSLTLTGVNANCRRGLIALSVTRPAVGAAAVQPVPVDNPWALLTLSVALAGAAAVVRRRNRSKADE